MEIKGLIAGLGNPGKEYESTRHNFGFMVVHALVELAERDGSANRLSKQSDPYVLWRCSFPGRGQWLLTTPLTYMNRSGDALQRIASYYRIEAESMLVIHDELDLPLGRMKMKKGGGNAGHNGLKSIQQMLGTPDFYRLRLGIGKSDIAPVVGHVLSRFATEEKAVMAAVIAGAVEGTLIYMDAGPVAAQRFCNGFDLPQAEKKE